METETMIETQEQARQRVRLGQVWQYWPLAAALPVAGAVAHLMARPKSWSTAQKAALAVAGTAAGLNLVRWQLQRFFTPLPRYEVLEKNGPFELRRYPAMVVAQTRVSSGFDEALSEGFARLANFIFGKNLQKKRVAMTSPVMAQHEQGGLDEPIAAQRDDGGYTVSFVMPRKRTVEDLPKPEDGRVIIRELQPRTVAALKFSGRYDGAHVRRATARLMEAARDRGIEVRGEPAFAGYDAPSTLPLLRRNEVWIEVAL